jgi:uncharacterized protein (DUF1015 family)
LILGRSRDTDSDEENKYKRAGRTLRRWREEGIIKRDQEEAFYVYRQDYSVNGKEHTRTGFMALMGLDSGGEDAVLPHENTLATPKEDRMRLISEVKCNLSPIFMLFKDRKRTVSDILEDVCGKESPSVDIMTKGIRNRLWKLTDKKNIDIIRRALESRRTIIADGHHRFEVARRYRLERQKDPSYAGEADNVLVYLTPMNDPDNLNIFPTHRVVSGLSVGAEKALEMLGAYFDIEECPDLAVLEDKMSLEKDSPHVFGIYIEGKFFLLVPRDAARLRGLIKCERSEEWRMLDVSVLHHAVLSEILGIEPGEKDICFVKTCAEAVEKSDRDDGAVAFFLNPTKVEQLRAVAEKAEMMPQKSTYFYPKLLSGLVMNTLEKDREDVLS